MTNQQGAPEVLALARAVDHWARCDYGLRGDEMRKAAAELRRLHYENERLAALVEAQHPAPSAAAALPEITAGDRLFLHYNPNTNDIVDWIQRYANAAITADRAARAPADSVLEDAARLDWLDQQCEAYGFQDIHEGNRWEISGAYANVREAIDAERAARKQGANHD